MTDRLVERLGEEVDQSADNLKRVARSEIRMTDRADEIAELAFTNPLKLVAAEIRAYGDERYKQGRAMGLRDSTNYGEGRLAGLEEAASVPVPVWIALEHSDVAMEIVHAIRALKEKP
jgi:hypothetical protein